VDAQTGKVSEFDVPTPYALPYALGVDKNDIVWFGEMAANRLGRFDPKNRTFREYPIPSRLSSVKKIDFTYSDGRTIVWSGYRTGPKLVAFEMPKE
jgi:streptogramin lyase